MNAFTLTRAQAATFVALIAAAVYANSLGNGFAFDDVAIIERNPVLHSVAGAWSMFGRGYWADPELALYRPFTTLTFAIDWQLATGAPWFFHFVNVLWHALASVLAFLLLLELAPLSGALAGALIFAVHPVHVEAVANIVGRAELIAGAATFGACIAWLRLQGGARALVVSGLYALALLSKESAIMLPALLLLVDRAAAQSSWYSTLWLREKAPALAALMLVGAGYLLLRFTVLDALAPARLDPSIEVLQDPWHRVLTALQVWPQYLRLFFYPRTLLADYGPRILLPIQEWNAGAAAGALILLSLGIGGMIALLRGRGRLALTCLWLPIAVLPVANLLVPIGILVAERTLYVPSFALAVGVAVVTPRLLAMRALRMAAATALAIAFVLLAARTVIRNPEWDSTDRILLALLRDRPDSFRAHWHAARIAVRTSDVDAALSRYQRAVELWPYRRGLLIEAGGHAAQHGRLGVAQDLARRATALDPRDVAAHRLLAGVSLDMADTATARSALRTGLALAPDDPLLLRMALAIDTTSTNRIP